LSFGIEKLVAWTVLFFVLVLVASGRFRIDLVALSGLLVLGLSGTAPPDVIFSGFGHPALATIVSVFLVSQGIVESGILRGLGQAVARRVQSLRGQTLSIAATGSILSAFMNNVGAVGLMLPTSVRMARRAGVDPGTFGLPLAMASILGGTMTLVGSAPNIIIATHLFSATGQSFRMFDYAPHGLAMLGMAFFMWFLCRSCGIVPGAGSSPEGDDRRAAKKMPVEQSEAGPVGKQDYRDSDLRTEDPTADGEEKDGLDEKFFLAPFSTRQKQVTLLILLAAVITVSFGVLHPAFGFGSAALLMMLSGVLKPNAAYKNIDLKIVFFLGSMLGIGETLEHTGALEMLSSALAGLTEGLAPFWLILMLIVVASILSNAINNSAAAVFMAPLAVGIAAGNSLGTAAALMATAAGSNLTLLIPTHQAALMVMSKAPFPISSFMRFGLVLTIMCILTAAAVISVVWR